MTLKLDHVALENGVIVIKPNVIIFDSCYFENITFIGEYSNEMFKKCYFINCNLPWLSTTINEEGDYVKLAPVDPLKTADKGLKRVE